MPAVVETKAGKPAVALAKAGGKMEKPELIATVAKEAGISEDEATKIIDAFVAEIKDGLAKGEKVNISGFGTFLLSRRRAKTFINPKTKQTHQIPEKMLPQFRPGSDFSAK